MSSMNTKRFDEETALRRRPVRHVSAPPTLPASSQPSCARAPAKRRSRATKVLCVLMAVVVVAVAMTAMTVNLAWGALATVWAATTTVAPTSAMVAPAAIANDHTAYTTSTTCPPHFLHYANDLGDLNPLLGLPPRLFPSWSAPLALVRRQQRALQTCWHPDKVSSCCRPSREIYQYQ